ncbi:MAG: hypothetical protein BWK80_29710 [Desulfobacteraceae bacterium IS3]|nr:MAG: hypothetical protein BWK80_29710 [Desulfobacteraceae bacterium IS3]
MLLYETLEIISLNNKIFLYSLCISLLFLTRLLFQYETLLQILFLLPFYFKAMYFKYVNLFLFILAYLLLY